MLKVRKNKVPNSSLAIINIVSCKDDKRNIIDCGYDEKIKQGH